MVLRRFFRHGLYKGLVALLFFTASLAHLVGQESAIVELSSSRVTVRDRVTVQIRTTLPWSASVGIVRPELSYPLVWWAYPYARPWSAEGVDGQPVQMVEVLASIRIDEPGFHNIDPFRITVGDQYAVTGIIPVIGLAADETSLPYPVEVGWRSVPERIWRGQALPVVLEARNLSSLVLADSVGFSGTPQGLLEEAQGLGGIETRPYENDILYDVPMGSWVWTPDQSGSLSFPSATASLQGIRRSADAFSVLVEDLPPTVRDSGAVGDFRLTVSWGDLEQAVDESLLVTVRVEGEGNLNVLRLPSPTVDGQEPTGATDASAYSPGPGGYEGWRERTYEFRLQEVGDHQAVLPTWAWLEPSGRVRTQRSERTSYTLRPADDPLEGQDQGLVFFGTSAHRVKSAVFHWRNPLYFLLALPGPLGLALWLFLKRRSKKSMAVLLVLPLFLSASSLSADIEAKSIQASRLVESEAVESASELYAEILDLEEIPGIHHELALLDSDAGNVASAIWRLRRALWLKPGHLQMQEDLRDLEVRHGLLDQIPVPLTWPPTLLFVLWLLSVNGLCGAAILVLRRPGATQAIVLIFSATLLLAASVGMIIADATWSVETAVVVAQSRPLRKIPGPLASDWIPLPAGTSVEILAMNGEDCLVRTGYGLEGWLERGDLRFVSEVDDGL